MVERTRGVLPSEGAEGAVPIPGPGPGPVPDPGPVPVSCHVVSCIFNWTRYTSHAHGEMSWTWFSCAQWRLT